MRTEAQKKAEQNYYNKNKERRKKQSEKSGARRYINKCDIEELQEVQQWLDNKMAELKD